MNERGTRKNGKDIGTPEKKKTATQPMAFGIAVGVFTHCSSLLSFAPSRTPLGYVRPTLSRKERFPEFKGNKQVIKRFKAIMINVLEIWIMARNLGHRI